MAIVMEIFQCYTFYQWPVRFNGYKLLDWLLAPAILFTDQLLAKNRFFKQCNIKTVCCMASYFIVYLAHVTSLTIPTICDIQTALLG